METINDLKKDREAMSGLHGIVDVLKGASSAQLRVMQSQEKDPIINKYIEDFFHIINLQHVVHPFLRESASSIPIVIAVTSDEGFTGELNNLVIEEALKDCGQNGELIVIGQRGVGAVEERGAEFTPINIPMDEVNFYPLAKAIVTHLVQSYIRRKTGRASVIYPRFISLSKQVMSKINLLPFHPKKVISESRQALPEVLIEPSHYRAVDMLIRIWMVQKLSDIFWESKLAHTASRILQLEGSSQELNKVEEQLRFKYFKLVHSKNDRSIREIFASRINLTKA